MARRLRRIFTPRRSISVTVAIALMASLTVVGPDAAIAQADQPNDGPGPSQAGPPHGPPDAARDVVPVAHQDDTAHAPRGKPFELQGDEPEAAVAQLDPVADLNTASGRYFGDEQAGTHVSELFPGVANYRAQDGTWKPIDASVTRVEGGYVNAANSFTTFFPSRLGPNAPMTTTYSDGSFSTFFAGQAPAEAVAGERSVAYRSIRPDTDAEFDLTTTGYVERIVLLSKAASGRISYRIQTDDLTLEKQDDNSIVVSSEKGVVATFAAPFAVDSATTEENAGQGARTDDLSVALRALNRRGDYELTIELAKAWLDAPGRVFPVTIDPTVVNSTDVIAGTKGSPLIKDTWASNDQPNTTHANSSELKVLNTSGGLQGNSYMTFDIAQEIRKVGPLIYDSTLRVDNWSSDPGLGQTTDVRRIKQHWEESTLTWSTKPNLDTPVWASHTCDNTCGQENFQIPSLMQWWVDHDDPAVPTNLGTNHGLALVAGNYPVAKSFRSKESASPPYLVTIANAFPSAPTPVAPVDTTVETTSPALRILDPNDANRIKDPNGDPVSVQYQVATSPSAGNIVWQSAWVDYTQGNSSYVVPAGTLQSGQSYFWRAISGDRCVSPFQTYTDGDPGEQALCKDLGRERPASSWQGFSINTKVRGRDHRWAMWHQSLGNGMKLSVNESNGNLLLEYPLDTLSTSGQQLDVGLSYNSQSTGERGLGPGWEVSAGPAAQPGQIPIRLEPQGLGAGGGPDASGNYYAVTLVYQSGRRDTFLREGDDELYAQSGPMAGTVRHDTKRPSCGATCRGWTYLSYSGGVYRFDADGFLKSAHPSTSTPVERGFDYDFQSHFPPSGGSVRIIRRVKDPLGRFVTFTYDGSLSRIVQVTDAAGRKWRFTYAGSPYRLDTVTAGYQTAEAETVKFVYNTSGRLSSVIDGEQNSLGANGKSTTITYYTPTNAPDSAVQQVKVAGSAQPWAFAYTWTQAQNAFADHTDVTDPRGVATADANDFKSTTYFNKTGFPIQITGPVITNPDGSTYRPYTYKLWDEHGNLVCERDPAANAVSDRPCVAPNPATPLTPAGGWDQDPPPAGVPATQLSDGAQTEYFYQPKAPYLLTGSIGPTKSPGAAGYKAADRLVNTHSYDDGMSGLVTQYFKGPDLIRPLQAGGVADAEDAMPNAEVISPQVDKTWSGAPAEITPTSDNFSVRFFGQIHADNVEDGADDNAFHFQLVHEDNARMIVGKELLFDCWSTGDSDPNNPTPDHTQQWTNCKNPSSIGPEDPQPEKVVHLAKGWHPIVVELQALTGPASVQLRWRPPGATTWSTVPMTALRPNLGDLTEQKTLSFGDFQTVGNTHSFSDTTYDYLSDDTKLRALSDSRRVAGDNTTAVKVDYTYDSLGRVKTEADALGRQITHDYTPNASQPGANPCEVKTVDRTNLTTNRTCDAAGNSTLVEDVVGSQSRPTGTVYDGVGRVKTVTYPDGGQVDFVYYKDDRLKQKTVKVATGVTRVYNYEYSPQGYLTKEIGPAPDPAQPSVRPTVQHYPDDVGNDCKVKDENSKVWLYDYNSLGERTIKRLPPAADTELGCSVIRTDGDRWRSNYDAAGNKISSVTPAGVKRTMTYDALGRLKSRHLEGLAAGSSDTWQYDAAGQIVSQTNADNITTSHTYDAFGNKVTESAPVRITPVGGSYVGTRSWTYDQFGFMTKSTSFRTDPASQSQAKYETTYVNDAMGRMTKVTSAPVHDKQTAGPVTSGAGAVNAIANYAYNAAGELVHVDMTDSGASNAAFKVDYTRDVMGRIKTATDGDGFVTTSCYDLVGELTQLKDPRGITLVYGYDGSGHRIQRKSIPSAIDCGGTLPAATTTENFGYDPAGNMTSAKVAGHPELDVTMTYDDAERIDVVHSGTDLTDYNYLANRLQNRVDTISGISYTTTYTYHDLIGRLKTVSDPLSGGTTTYSDYTNVGLPTRRVDANGLVHVYGYDRMDRPSSETVTDGTHQVASFASSYDEDSNVIGRTMAVDGSIDNVTWSYVYDGLNRLVQAHSSAPQSPAPSPSPPASPPPPTGETNADYAYDGASNRTKVVSTTVAAGQPATTTTTTTYDPAGRPTSSSDGATTTNYAHDNAGNLISVQKAGTGWTYDYDPWARQTKATQTVGAGNNSIPNPLALTYTYDALDRTIEKDARLVTALVTSPPITSDTFSYAGISDELIQKRTSVLGQNQNVAALTSYANDPGGAPLVIKKSVTTTPIDSVTGQLGTPVNDLTIRFAGLGPHGDLNYTTNPDGDVAGSYTYDPWGVPRSAVGKPSFLGFQADPTDENTGLVDMGARNYLPELGRFTTQDPVAGDQSNPLSMNPYVYGGLNPATMSDPTGEMQIYDPPCTCGGSATSSRDQNQVQAAGVSWLEQVHDEAVAETWITLEAKYGPLGGRVVAEPDFEIGGGGPNGGPGFPDLVVFYQGRVLIYDVKPVPRIGEGEETVQRYVNTYGPPAEPGDALPGPRWSKSTVTGQIMVIQSLGLKTGVEYYQLMPRPKPVNEPPPLPIPVEIPDSPGVPVPTPNAPPARPAPVPQPAPAGGGSPWYAVIAGGIVTAIGAAINAAVSGCEAVCPAL